MRTRALVGVLLLSVAAPVFLSLNAVADPVCEIAPGADLTGCDFRNANLAYANFTNATIEGAKFSGATFTGVISSGLNGIPESLPSDYLIIGRTFIGPGVNLDGASLTGWNLSSQNLSNATLTNTNLTNTNLTNTNLSNAELSSATITGARFSGATFSGITSAGLIGIPASLPSDSWSIVSGTLIGPGVNLTNASLSEWDLTGANLTGANLTNAYVNGTNLTDANLTDANLTNADLGYADLTGATTTRASISVDRVYRTRVGDFLFNGECVTDECSSYTGDLRLVGYSGVGTTLTIPSTALGFTVASIGASAFAGANALQGSLVIPDSITYIGNSAFSEVGFDETLTLGAGLEWIGSAAFRGTQFIGTLTIPSNVTDIEAQAFEETEFDSLELGSSVRSIGLNAFANTPLSGSLVIPDSVVTIGQSAFYGTRFTGTLTLGENLETIGDAAFYPGPGLNRSEFTGTLTIPSRVTTIGAGAFVESEFTQLIFDPRYSATTIGNDAFKDMTTLTGDLILPEGVTSIGTYAFSRAGDAIPSGTALIGALSLPDSLTTISDSAFSSARFTSVRLGTNLTSIGLEAFRNVPLTGTLTLPSNVTDLGARAFELTQITSVSFPSGLTSIGDGAFDRATSLRGELTLPTGLETLGSTAFYGTSISGSLVIPAGITSIASETFYATQISSVSLSRATTSIGAGAFFGTAVETLTLPRTLTSIGASAFASRKTYSDSGSVDLVGGTFTFEGNAPSIHVDAFTGAEDLLVRYPEGASGWPIDPSPFGLRASQVAVAAPPSPSPEPSAPASAPTSEATSSPGVDAPLRPISQQPSNQAPGTTGFVIDGQVIPVTSEPGPRGTGLTLQAGPVEFTLRSQTANGQRVPLAADGSLILPRTGEVPISGDGLEPNSSVAVTLFSNPISLGSTPVGADGTFRAAPVIPSTVPLGAHTLQLTGRTKGGDPFVLSIGVLVETPAAALGADPIISVRPAIITPGTSVAVTARGVQAGCRVTFTLAGKRATTTASKKGVAQAQITMPKRLPRTAVVRGTVSGPKCTSVSVSSRVPTRRGSAMQG